MRIDRLALLALEVVADAVARAALGEVERTWGHRLALEYLVKIGAAERWQAAAFWEELAWECHPRDYEHGAVYMQTTRLTSALNAWSYNLGREPPDPVEMAHRVRRLALAEGTQQNPCMCNRYRPGERATIREFFGAKLFREVNDGPAIVHPKDPGWVVRLVDGEPVLDQMTWGFPVTLRGKRGQPLKPKPVNNARFDKLGGYWKHWAQSPANRCIIPAAAYAEAVGETGHMTTTWLSVKGEPLFAWAGLWRESDEWGACYTGVMTDNAPALADIHDRSPVIIDRADWSAWLTAPLGQLARFDRPYPADRIAVQHTQIPWKYSGAETTNNN
ncbi:SOS response-associated peptidase [Novosphingobium sp.]|uniref:SOS response-associated peptidase n=1 Tax=Novosphingobium sp. TaxID=1874826 RepID=UPI0038B9BAAD